MTNGGASSATVAFISLKPARGLFDAFLTRKAAVFSLGYES